MPPTPNLPTLATKEWLLSNIRVYSHILMQADHQLVFVVLSHKSLCCNISAKQWNTLFQLISTNSIFKVNTSQAALNNKLTNGSAIVQTTF